MNRNLIIASVIGVVFLFAGYNLYSYFKEQQAIQAAEDLRDEQRRVEREAERVERAAAQAAEQQRLEEEREARSAAQAQEEAERQARRDQERLEAEAKARVEREAREQAKLENEQARLQERIARARSRDQIEDFSPEFVNQIRTLSPRYLQANPDDALFVHSVPDNARVYPNGFGQVVLYRDQSTFLMVVSALSQNPDVVDTIIGLGGDINASNKMGFTPLMFAAAYNTPEMVQHILDQGADPLVVSLAGDANALHIAASMNPNPGVIDVLINAGLPLEDRMVKGNTPLLMASEDNTNIEVAGRLVELGADVSSFNDDGITPEGFITQRLGNRGKRFTKISDEVNERVLQAVALTP